eukprot:scaffold103253_cov51-Phaeocystis_antarctica.AAC.1
MEKQVLSTAAANGPPSPPHLVGRKHKDAAHTRRRTSADGADGPSPVTCSELHAGRLGRRSRQDTGSKSFERRQVRELSPQVVRNCVQTTTATPSEGKTESQKKCSPGPGVFTELLSRNDSPSIKTLTSFWDQNHHPDPDLTRTIKYLARMLAQPSGR